MKFLDLFSGIGGFRLGMEMSGHECVGHCEIDKYADKSYRAMFDVREDEYFATDVRGIIPSELPDFDCICGGFPCQSFSIAGKRGGFEDTRGTLFFEIARIVSERQPRIVFLENVAGLLRHDSGSTFETILRTLGELGYWFEYQVLNSKDFGVPQNRERVFIVGHLGGKGGRAVFPIRYDDETITELQGQQNVTNCLTARYGEAQGNGSYIIECEQHAQTIIDPQGRKNKKIKNLDTVPTLRANTHGNLPCVVRQIGNIMPTSTRDNPNQGRVYDADGLSPCLNKMDGGGRVPLVSAVLTPDREYKRQNGRRIKEPGEETFTLTAQDKHGVTDGTRVRRLTPLECFRLQGFPDELFYKARAVNSDSQLYKQAGNSVTVNVIYEIARRMK